MDVCRHWCRALVAQWLIIPGFPQLLSEIPDQSEVLISDFQWRREVHVRNVDQHVNNNNNNNGLLNKNNMAARELNICYLQ